MMVSLPDELLRAVDVEAARRGTTRSGLIRGLAKEALSRRSESRRARMAEIDALGKGRYGGNVGDVVKASRPLS